MLSISKLGKFHLPAAIVSAVGLVGLSVYHLSLGHFDLALASFLTAMTAAGYGVRSQASDKAEATIKP